MPSEHFKKFNKLAHKLGWHKVLELVPVPLTHVRAALDAGDEHLNTIPLHLWDNAALGPQKDSRCPCCNQIIRYMKPIHGCDGPLKELFHKAKLGHSLSGGVSVLKHVAKVEALKLEVSDA